MQSPGKASVLSGILLLAFSLFSFPVGAQPIPFEHVVIDREAKGSFTRHRVDQGKESHLGVRVGDMDGDGDLEILSIAWDNYQFLRLWRNDARTGAK